MTSSVVKSSALIEQSPYPAVYRSRVNPSVYVLATSLDEGIVLASAKNYPRVGTKHTSGGYYCERPNWQRQSEVTITLKS